MDPLLETAIFCFLLLPAAWYFHKKDKNKK